MLTDVILAECDTYGPPKSYPWKEGPTPPCADFDIFGIPNQELCVTDFKLREISGRWLDSFGLRSIVSDRQVKGESTESKSSI